MTIRDKVPFSFSIHQGQVHWITVEASAWREPFFYDTIRRSRRCHPVTTTSLDVLLNTPVTDAVPPTAFIFHVSRCGSTLLTQMMVEVARNRVLSEPTIVDDLLQSDLPPDMKQQALIQALKYFGCRQQANIDYLFVKLDAWHLLYMDCIRAAFSQVPCVGLFREPGAVLRSHQRERGRHMVPGMLRVSLTDDDVFEGDLNDYAVKVLKRLYTTMDQQAASFSLLLDYAQLPDGLDEVLKMADCCYTPSELASMRQRARHHSKDPLSFFEKTPVLQAPDVPGMQHLQAIYQQLQFKSQSLNNVTV